jgi:cell division GTPase FtsZ
MGLQEIHEASEVIFENADDNANIIFGALVDPTMTEGMSITVLACDFQTKDGPPDDKRAATFYKDRRLQTKSPLGPDATLEETRVAITRGFKKPPPLEDNLGKRNTKGLRGFLLRILGGE